MEYLVKNEKLQLNYEPGKGAWTYNIQIPNTKHIIGKWGSLKVAGYVDDFFIDSINLFSIKGQNKLISINEKIRKAINKTGGDTVIVSLYLLTPKQQISETEILETLKESGVLEIFESLAKDEKATIIKNIIAITTEEKQVNAIIKWIEKLGRDGTR